MESVYVVETGAYLRKDGMSLKVVKDNTVLEQIPADGLKRLILIGYVSLSGSVLDFLIQNQIETVFVTPTGRFRARIGLDEHRHVTLRKAQYVRLSDPSFALPTAQSIISGKVTNMLRFLLNRSKQYEHPHVKIAAIKLKAVLAQIPLAKNMEMLRGFEGLATRFYFDAFPYLIQNENFFFKERNKRPPRDPVNAMLSFIYMMLTNEVLSAIQIAGLDPYMGALHEIAYGRPSLACDLVEEYRCFLGDRMVLNLINKRLVKPDDFVYRDNVPAEFADEQDMKTKRPVEMKPQVAKTFIAAYEQMMKRTIQYPYLNKKITYRWLILNQVRRFAEYLEHPENPYQPFVWEA